MSRLSEFQDKLRVAIEVSANDVGNERKYEQVEYLLARCVDKRLILEECRDSKFLRYFDDTDL